jgi:serine phosphatase RsbU (regulator of sigma subunit)
VGGRQAYVTAVEALRRATQIPTGDADRAGPDRTVPELTVLDRATVDRAVGLLAGRTSSRLSDAHRHLLRMAADQQRDVAEIAAGVLSLLDVAGPVPDRGPPSITSLLRAAGQVAVRPFDPWLVTVQRILDLLSAPAAFLTPVRDPEGRLIDLVFGAASPAAVVADGLRGAQLVGLRVAETLPESVASDRWHLYARVLDTGEPAEVSPFVLDDAVYAVRAHRLGDGLFLTWTRHDDMLAESDRVASTERLGNLGWGEWDLISGEVRWSAQLYRIYERDPALGPMSHDESEALAVPEDLPLRVAALAAFERSDRVDVITRVRINGRIKHLRTVADAVRDADGLPLRIYGIVQDVTDQETAAHRLVEVERQLVEQRRTLDAEHELAARLQQIILPLPDGPIELPGLKVALRYLPAGQESLVGGDWYHADTLRDGSVLLAVGDVAGHGTPAATTMAQLRHALRALAVTTTDPGVLLGHLNRLTCDLEKEHPELAATAVVARYDPLARRLTWAQAGHPPPLLCRAGRTRPLTRPHGLMLGVADDATYPCATLDLAVGDVLLLYTDGLVEHRGRGPDDGLAAVTAAVDDAVAMSPSQPLGALLDRLRRANPDDDTCILAARPATGETRDLRSYLSRPS